MERGLSGWAPAIPQSPPPAQASGLGTSGSGEGTHILLTSVPAAFSSTSSVTSRPAGNWGCCRETPAAGRMATHSCPALMAEQPEVWQGLGEGQGTGCAGAQSLQPPKETTLRWKEILVSRSLV